tara:strand:+ start:25052 stop:25501 length:450 start_codon:yes stop_codon:yes gene_type:complete
MTKKFKDTKVGSFLIGDKGILKHLGDIVPDKGFLGVLKNLITKDNTLSPFEKEKALELLKMDIIEMEQISERWSSDMTSDSWLSKNTRPLTLLFLTLMTTLFVILDSSDSPFKVSSEWIELLKTLLVTVYVAYFGSRGFEKYNKIRSNI